jgi:hypothetical protein
MSPLGKAYTPHPLNYQEPCMRAMPFSLGAQTDAGRSQTPVCRVFAPERSFQSN